MMLEEVQPLSFSDGSTVVCVHDVADVIQEVLAECEVRYVVMECSLLLMVQF